MTNRQCGIPKSMSDSRMLCQQQQLHLRRGKTPRTPAVNSKPRNPSLILPLRLVRLPSLLRMPMQDHDTKAESADRVTYSGILCIISKFKNVIEMNLTSIFFLEYNLTCKMHDIFACTMDLLQYLLQKSK